MDRLPNLTKKNINCIVFFFFLFFDPYNSYSPYKRLFKTQQYHNLFPLTVYTNLSVLFTCTSNSALERLPSKLHSCAFTGSLGKGGSSMADIIIYYHKATIKHCSSLYCIGQC